jgi:16S rRNA (uracil1498-N3)-methyltransferase
MQLFISTEYTIDHKNIAITDPRIIHQCLHVLRYKPWQIIQLQHIWVRYTLSITSISKKQIYTIIEFSQEYNTVDNIWRTTIYIALPNRRDKAELMVQKCTEIGIDTIIFWKAERSRLRDISDKTLHRLQTISVESSEQSFRRSIPEITYLDNLFETPILWNGRIIFFHQDGDNTRSINTDNHKPIWAIIGPEWWFSPWELEQFYTNWLNNYSLGNTILRMETAAIIWSWSLKNL